MVAPIRYSSPNQVQLASPIARICELLEPCAGTLRCHANQRVTNSTSTPENWFRVLTGAARQYGLHPDGRRQIVDLLLPGDWFGFADRDDNWLTVEAVIEGTTLTRYVPRRTETPADPNLKLAQLMCGLRCQTISRLQRQLDRKSTR